ncbi:MAG: adenylosuccinate synthetase [Bacteroidia bacterium]|nr:adenylosuccinate synthetase [Bacteroidia bacterium]
MFFQIPTDAPKPDAFGPVDFSKWYNILFYIGVPILMFIIFRIWLKNKDKRS